MKTKPHRTQRSRGKLLVFCDLRWAGVALQPIARLPFIAPPPEAAFILLNLPFLFLKAYLLISCKPAVCDFKKIAPRRFKLFAPILQGEK
ncbi:MAG: hypothetical protein ACREV0_02305 [Burkholderiales bacterium]